MGHRHWGKDRQWVMGRRSWGKEWHWALGIGHWGKIQEKEKDKKNRGGHCDPPLPICLWPSLRPMTYDPSPILTRRYFSSRRCP